MTVFDKKRVLRWRRDIWRIYERLGLKGPEIHAAMVFAGIVAIGTHPASLSELTGLTTDYVVKVTRRLRSARVVIGQEIRTPLVRDGFDGEVGGMLDAMVACGLVDRCVDPKRSAAQKARKPETRARGPRRPRAVVSGAYTPTLKNADSRYGLPEWRDK